MVGLVAKQAASYRYLLLHDVAVIAGPAGVRASCVR
jgi:hypothetical protein